MFLLESLFHSIAMLLAGLTVVGLLSLCGGTMLALALRLRDLRWGWSALPVMPALLCGYVSLWLALTGVGVCIVGCIAGMVWHAHDLMAGGDYAEAARRRVGPLEALRRYADRWAALRQPQAWLRGGRLEVGIDAQGMPVTIPAGGSSGSHTLILGATGSGKTCGQAWIAGRLVEHGHGAIAIDPKGDPLLRAELERAAEVAEVKFLAWGPDGPLAYNPYAHGSPTEIADKALSGEVFTEPHYLRQAQRYLGHAVRAMRGADNVPESAETIAALAGTRPAWVTTQQTSSTLLGHGPTGAGSRRRGHEPIVHPTRIKQLRTGQAVVITPGSEQEPVLAQIHQPSIAH